MEWTERMNNAVSYIEEHIKEEIDYVSAAKAAYCSVYHFQRIFAYMADMPLSEYIRRRRMSLAAEELQSGSGKIIDIALNYGYSSPTAFNRAFRSIHGIPPSEARTAGIQLKSFPRISFRVIIKGAEEMNYRIEKKDAFRIIGISMPLHKEIDMNFEIVPQMWDKAAQDGTLQKLTALMNSQPAGMLGVSICGNEENWKYFIAVSSQDTDGEWEEYTVPALEWAVFSGHGNGRTVQELEKRIITEWLPSSGYEYDSGPDIELYLDADPQDMKFEVWIPVKKAE